MRLPHLWDVPGAMLSSSSYPLASFAPGIEPVLFPSPTYSPSSPSYPPPMNSRGDEPDDDTVSTRTTSIDDPHVHLTLHRMFHPLNALIFCPYMQECLPIGRQFFGDVNDTNLRFISNNHCEITYSNDQFLIRDTASTNGTWLNHSTLATNERKVVIQNDFISLASPMFSDDFDATKSSIVIFWTRIAPQYHPLD